MNTAAAHAVWAPSSAHRWGAEGGCTASAEAIAALGEQEEGEEAKDGTAAHDEIERILGPLCQTSLAKDPMPYPVSEPIDYNHPAAYGIALLVDFVRQLTALTPGGGKLWIEQRVRLTDDIWGRCDVAHWDEANRILTIVDYKNGFVNVEAKKNEQLRIYAAGSIFTHNLPAKWIRYVVVQPNSFLPVPRVKQWPESADDLYAFAQRVAKIPGGPKQFVAGEQCTYCPLFGLCPASRDVLTRLGSALANRADQVPVAHRTLFAAMKKPIEDWFKAADKVWTRDAIKGAVPPGMMLVQTQKHRAWKPQFVEPLKEAIYEEYGLDHFELPTPTQAEERKLIDPKLVAQYSDRPPGGPALKFESDSRPAWKQMSAAEMFAAVTGGAK